MNQPAARVVTERPQGTKPYAPNRHGMQGYTELAAAFVAGTDSPRHFLERCLDAIGRDDGWVRAFTALDADLARIAADDAAVRFREGRQLSPVDGMPIAVKDIIETTHLPTEMNSPIYKGYYSRRDASCVIALQQAGAVILGKTVTTEFACGRAGLTRNPYDPSRTPGGSSSGSAAAVGAGFVPSAIGTQTQASVIRPASYCGAWAIKPSHGLLRFDGCAPLARSMDTLGIFGATLADAWAVVAAISGVGPEPDGPEVLLPAMLPEGRLPACLVRLDTVGWREVDDTSRAAFEDAISRLSAAGVRILDRRNSAAVEEMEQLLLRAPEVSMEIFAYESAWPLRAYADRGDQLVGERVRDLIARAGRMGRADYRRAVAERTALRRKAAELAESADGFVTLASSGPAIADIAYTGSRSYPVPWSLVAGPSIALPVMQSAGLPLGLQLMGIPGRDVETAAIASAVAGLLLG